MPARTHARSAFTLIELLVVVAIIALLLAILLPSLERAREQGRIAVCTSNMKSIAGAAVQYLLEDKSQDLPWCVPWGYKPAEMPNMPNFNTATEMSWGGGAPQKSNAETAQAGLGGLETADCYVMPARYRPMNRYVFPGVSFDSGDRDTAETRRSIPMTLPGVYKCPSDRTPYVPGLGMSNPYKLEDEVFPTWDYWGTSYPINWYWANYYKQGVTEPPYAGSPPRALGIFAITLGIKGDGARMLKRDTAGWSSRFVIFYENLFNYASEDALPSGVNNPQADSFVGWHKQRDFYVAAYLDGHADYRRRDTRYVDGPGWTTWPSRPWGGDWKDY